MSTDVDRSPACSTRTDSRPPRIIPRPDHCISRKNISSAAVKVLNRLNEEGFTAYLAGGGVRDLLLGRTPKDFDIATNAKPEEIKRIFRNSRLIGRRFRLAHVLFRGEMIEVSTFRAPVSPETGTGDGHTFREQDGLILRDNVWGTPEEDAFRRDFTVNALFYNIDDFSVLDYTGGLDDLAARTLRVIGPPDQRFTEDPVRMIRAVRFAACLDFAIEPDARAAIIRNAEKIAGSASARLYEEVQKLFCCGCSEQVFRLLLDLRLFEHLFPELGGWLKDPKGEASVHWFEKVFRQFDRFQQAGLSMHSGLMFALLFGIYHEQKARLLMETGLPASEALHRATVDHIRALTHRISIPRAETARIAQLMALQPRFEKTNTKQARKTRHHRSFQDAYLYFKFAAKALNRHHDLLKFWESLRTAPAAARAE